MRYQPHGPVLYVIHRELKPITVEITRIILPYSSTHRSNKRISLKIIPILKRSIGNIEIDF